MCWFKKTTSLREYLFLKKSVTKSVPHDWTYLWPEMLSSVFFVCLGTCKKYHEHIRKTALGKITDDTKKEKRENLRKEQVCDSERNY